MNREEQLEAMLSKAEKLGLELRFANGLLTIRQTREVDDDTFMAMASNLSERAAEVRTIAERRAIAERVQDFIGSRVWVHGYGEGRLDGVGSDGRLSVRARPEGFNGFVSVTATAETVVILDERPSEAPAVAEANSKPAGRGGLIQTIRDTFRGDA